jgi:hypothetical protein
MISSAKQVFKPELLNRFDDIVVFRKLERGDVLRIMDIELSRVKTRLSQKGLELRLSDSATEFLLEKGYDQSLGARPLRRAVERYVEDPVAEDLLRQVFTPPCLIQASRDLDGDRLIFSAIAAETSVTDASKSDASVEETPDADDGEGDGAASAASEGTISEESVAGKASKGTAAKKTGVATTARKKTGAAAKASTKKADATDKKKTTPKRKPSKPETDTE